MENESSYRYIESPNLETAQTVFIIAIGSKIVFSQPMLNLFNIGVFDRIMTLAHLSSFFYIWALVLWGQYLNNFKMRRAEVLMYLIAGCMGVSKVAHIAGILFYSDSYFSQLQYLDSFLSVTSYISHYAITVLVLIAGYDHIMCKDDYVGGLKLIGQLMVIIGFLWVLNIIISLFVILRAYYLSDFESLDHIPDISNALSQILTISLLAYMLYIIRGAMRYNNNVDEDDIDIGL